MYGPVYGKAHIHLCRIGCLNLERYARAALHVNGPWHFIRSPLVGVFVSVHERRTRSIRHAARYLKRLVPTEYNVCCMMHVLCSCGYGTLVVDLNSGACVVRGRFVEMGAVDDLGAAW